MRRFYGIGLVLLIVILTPFVLWRLETPKKINIAIIDKTVPNETYREHLGLTWVLNYLHYYEMDGKPISPQSDYYGFVPKEKDKDYQIRETPKDFSDYDIIYSADTYGVYEDDLPWLESKRKGSRTEEIFGGLEEEEWTSILDRLKKDKKSLFIAEFNTFASPTKDSVKNSITDYLGLNWSGWTGRYFDELNPDKNKEIPQWLLDEFKGSWNYSGEGFALVNDINNEVVVIETGKHVGKGGIKLDFTKEGKELFGLNTNPEYKYWFDIVTPKSGTKVLANYQWDLTKEGRDLLKKHQIPLVFSAVLSSQVGASSSCYFAGDYNDIGGVPTFYQMKWLDTFYQKGLKYSDDAFYWSAYVPMMKVILEQFHNKQDQVKSLVSKDLQYNSRVHNNSIQIYKNNKWTSMTIKGVNLGMGKPGYFPGEAAITEEEYYDWFVKIGEMNANSIRVYTLHPPGFYRALKKYNEEHLEDLYIFHGVWINEEKLVESQDAFEKVNIKNFQIEIKKIVDVVHGNNIVDSEPGHASGVYNADVSKYVIGWLIGIEWDPYMVLNTNTLHQGMADFDGRFFQTKGAQPFEVWVAEQMEFLVNYERDKYSWIRPMSFTNWVTTDLLDHPAEPDEKEDLVSVDPNVIYTNGDMKKTEQFASYHIYPYYPDFFNYEEKYLNYKDHRGNNNSYAGYLKDLHEAHRLPILVAEFGIPPSRGMTHENSFGWNQGFISEKQQGEITKSLFEDIIAEKFMGGLIFTWQDEWFKRTWNTMDYDNPDRRPYWSNAQTNEQQFGLLSFDRHKIQVDGSTKDWNKEPLYEGKGSIKALFVDHDERYLYIRMDYDPFPNTYPTLLLDTVPNQGNHFIEGSKLPTFEENGADYLIKLNATESRILVDSYYNAYLFQYGHQLEMLKPKPVLPIKGSGKFSRINYALNKELHIPSQNRVVSFQSYETGKLLSGNGNPEDSEYNSLTDYHISKDGVLELRIPWLLIQAKDPSQREFTGDIYANGLDSTIKVKGISISAMLQGKDQEVVDSLPAIIDNKLPRWNQYTWETWNVPESKERLKQSYFIVKDLFKKY